MIVFLALIKFSFALFYNFAISYNKMPLKKRCGLILYYFF